MENEINLAFGIGLFCLIMFVISLFVITMQINHRRKTLLKDSRIKELEIERRLIIFKATLDIEDKEKERIYANMHDQVNPLLRFVMRRIELHRIRLAKNELKVESLDEDIGLLLKAIESIRESIHDLVPSYMLEYGLVKGLNDIFQKLNSPEVVTTSFNNYSNYHDELPLPIQEQVGVYRICLELVNNILKHSSCTKLELNIHANDQFLSIELVHNGKGIDNVEADKFVRLQKGTGLKSIFSRVLSLNAKIDFKKDENKAQVFLNFPIKNESKN